MYINVRDPRFYMAWGAVVIAMGVIIILKIMSDSTVAATSPVTTTPGTSLDTILHKGAHLGMFAGFAWLLCLAAWISWREVFGWPLAITASAALSALSEWLQTMSPGRFGTPEDVVIDVASALLGMAFWVSPWVAVWLWTWVRNNYLAPQATEA